MDRCQRSKREEKHHDNHPAERSVPSPCVLCERSDGGGGGEPQSFEELLASDELYPIMRDWLLPIAVALHLPTDQMEDVLQEVCLAMLTLKHPPSFIGANRPWQLRWWIRTMMRNKTVDALRRLRSSTLGLDVLAGALAAPEKRESERKLHLWLREQLEAVAKGESLNARLLYGRYVEGKTNKELAAEYSKEQNNLTEKSVECRICRQIEELRQKAVEDGLIVPAPGNGSLKKKMGKKTKK